MALLIRETAPPERPRERLAAGGPRALSDAELLALLLRTGSRGQSAVDLARCVLLENGGLDGIAARDITAIRRAGLGSAKASAVVAAMEIGRRLARREFPEREAMRQPAAVARYLTLRFDTAGQEVMGALFVDTRHRLLGESELFRGTLDRAAVEPRAILREALLRQASGMIAFHTHPSGDPSPSAEDLAFTRRLVTAGEAVGVKLLDHLILGHGGGWISLRERGAC
jgi:DNA repair protein RadC